MPYRAAVSQGLLPRRCPAHLSAPTQAITLKENKLVLNDAWTQNTKIHITNNIILTTLFPSRAYLTAVATEGNSLSLLNLLKKPWFLSATHTGVVGAERSTCTPHESYSLTI